MKVRKKVARAKKLFKNGPCAKPNLGSELMGGLQVKSASEDAIAMASIDILKGFMATRFLSPGEIAHNRSVVLATYRHLLRATGIAFRGPSLTSSTTSSAMY